MCDKIDFELCRLCLNSGGFLINIFDDNNKLEIMLEKTIEDLLDVKVVEEAGCPWLVCGNCMEKLTEFRLFKRRCAECLFVFYNRIQKGCNPATKDWINDSLETKSEEEGAVPSSDEHPEDAEPPGEELDHGTSANVWAISSAVDAVDDSVQLASTEMEGTFSDLGTRGDSTASNGAKTRDDSECIELHLSSDEEVNRKEEFDADKLHEERHLREKELLSQDGGQKLGGPVEDTAGTVLHVCQICNKVFAKSDLLKDHVMHAHLDKVVEEAGCPWLVCGNCMEKLTEFRLFKRRCAECLFVFYNRIQKGCNPATKDWINDSLETKSEEEGAVPSSDEHPEDAEPPGEELDHGTSANVWAISSAVDAVDDSVQLASTEMEGTFSDLGTRGDSTASNGAKTRFPSGIKEEGVEEGIDGGEPLTGRSLGVRDDASVVKGNAVVVSGCPSAAPENDTPSPSTQGDDGHWSDDEDQGNVALGEDGGVDGGAVDIKEEFAVDDGVPGRDASLVQGHRTLDVRCDPIALSPPFPGGELKLEPQRTAIASVKPVEAVNGPVDEINDHRNVSGRPIVDTHPQAINDCDVRSIGHLGSVSMPPGDEIPTANVNWMTEPQRSLERVQSPVLLSDVKGIEEVDLSAAQSIVVGRAGPSLSLFSCPQSLTNDILKGQAFQCAVCGFVFATKALVETHMKSHIESQFFRCDTCFVGFGTRSEYETHMLSHSQTGTELDKSVVECRVGSVNGKVNSVETSAPSVVLSEVSPEASTVVEEAVDSGTLEEVRNRIDLSGKGGYGVGGVVGSNPALLLGNCGITTIIIPQNLGVQSGLLGEGQCGSPLKAGKVPIRSNRKPKVTKVSECYVCKVCGRIYGRNIQLSAHMRAHRPKTYSCKTCAKTFTDKLTYNRHRHMHLVVEKPFKCTVCSKGFPHKQALALHMVTHTGAKPHVCEVCSKAFSQRSNLRTHMTVHSNERPHVCNVCSKAFSLKQALVIHMRTHTGEKPFCCKLCSRSFSRSCHLRMHMARHRGEKHHSCGVCAKAFIEKGDLKKHMRVHTKERPYRCKYCTNVYSDASMLNRHMALHTGDSKFSCEVCSQKFMSKTMYKNHMYKHRVEESFRCDVCSEAFSSKQQLKAHVVMHGNKSFKCFHCSFGSHRKSSLRNHIEREHGKEDDTTT
ncbi:uncharacterized protein [Hetaerina americana]|uniref:uncharacterized protein n=1 Tax=Hetaerina americana TaxID=62018 RepID=UPI003A7F1C96